MSKEEKQQEEVDDSGFYAGKAPLVFQSVPLQKPSTPIYHLLPGGPVPRVDVTITMTDELLNGTNRVVLDGVMTEKECDRILQLAKVCWDKGDESDLALKTKLAHSVFYPVFTECGFSRGRLQGATVSAHSS